MREPSVILIHNRYQQAGGEDDVFAAEAALLARFDHTVSTYTADNREISGMARSSLVTATFWNRTVCRQLQAMLVRRAPTIAHFHNTFPLVSPAAYYAARRCGIAVVQTLHNYRLICPNAMLLRKGRPCERCVGKVLPWPGIIHRCYRRDWTATMVTASMVASHRILGTWQNAVTVYVALTEFARRKFIEGGLPADRIVVKPNFLVRDPGTGGHKGGFALYVGRLTAEKGISNLLGAWKRVRGLPLKILGTGPAEQRMQSNVEWLGWRPADEVLALMNDAAFLVLPSTWYEGFPVTLVQAFATGLPVIVSGHGAMAEIVDDGRTGRHCRPGDVDDLAEKVEWAFTHPREVAEMGREARLEFERRYTAEHNYARLMQIYSLALEKRDARPVT